MQPLFFVLNANVSILEPSSGARRRAGTEAQPRRSARRRRLPGQQRTATRGVGAVGRHRQFGDQRRQNKNITININQHRFIGADLSVSPRG